jgi:hypothetical protein
MLIVFCFIVNEVIAVMALFVYLRYLNVVVEC